MEFEVSVQSHGTAVIEFNGYEKLLSDAKKLGERMKQEDVTEENIQESKALLAQVRKQIKALDEERKKVKREVMTPYDELNEKIQTLKNALAEGEEHINAQVKEFTRAEQEKRKLQIKDLFTKYQQSYNAPQWLTFTKFINKNTTLVTNKATSQKAIRTAIVNYFEKFNTDYAMLKEQFKDKDERSAILIAYSDNGFNMNEAILNYTMMIAEKERLEREQERVKETKVPDIEIITGNENKTVDKPKEVCYTVIKVKTEDLSKLKQLGIDWEEL